MNASVSLAGAGADESLERVIAFLNTFDVEDDTDDLATPESYRAWLTATSGSDDTAADDGANLALARQVRDGLRASARANHDGPAAAADARLNEQLEQVPLVIRIGADGAVALAPGREGVLGVLGDVLARIARAAADGTWARVKICPSDACELAFVDKSRNGSRRWCSMAACGNRQKTRTYRARASE